MKNMTKVFVIVTLSIVISCKKTEVSSSLTGNWKISSLVIDSIDKTNLVSQYVITFDNNGMMSVYDGMNTYNCSYSGGGGMMGGMMDDYSFDMKACPDNSPMHDLDAEWIIDNKNENNCYLHEKNAGNNVLVLARF